MLNNILKKINTKNKLNFHKDTNNMLSLLIKYILESKESYDNHIVQQQTFQMEKISNAFLDSIPEFISYPEKIQTHIRAIKHKIKIHFTFTIRKHQFNISIISDKNQSIDIDLYLEYIYRWLYVATLYANNNCSKYLDVFIFTTKLKKTMPSKKSTLNENNCNTAFTTVCKPRTSIHLYRQEEWFKVFIHETFHCLGLDFSSLNQYACKHIIFSIFPLKIDLRLYECYTETFSEIIQLLFLTSELHDTDHKILVEFKKELINLQKFSFFQCAKILDYYHLKVEDLHKPQTLYKENTAVFSYYILKSMMLFHIDDFLNWCSQDNGSIQFLNTQKNLENFCLFIKNTLESKNQRVYNAIIEETTPLYQKTTSKELKETLKMTHYVFP